ncbi:hypothetical protein AHYW_004425 (plasmid) [Providencia manganoxydans]
MIDILGPEGRKRRSPQEKIAFFSKALSRV